MLFVTPPLTIIDRPADRLHYGGTRLGHRFFTIHATATPRDAQPDPVENALRWLTTASPPSNPVSTHRLIAKDGRIYKIVSDEQVAWHAGFATVGPLPRKNPQGAVVESFNQWSLGIELDNSNDGKDPYPAAQLNACADQIVEWIGAYGMLAPVGHAWVDVRKTDPRGFDWQDFYRRVWERMKVIAKR